MIRLFARMVFLKSAVEAIKLAVSKGFRVTVNCTLFQGEKDQEVARIS